LKVLVTGGAGFIGSNITHRLVKTGHTVRVLDNFATGQRENLADYFDSVELIEGDIRDFWTVAKATKGIECIIHEAALPSVLRSIDNPLTTTEVNINGTLNLLEASRFNGVRRLVFASSSSVYGDSPESCKNEELKPRPKSPYAITKLAAEEYCLIFNQLYGLETVALRYFNVFGPYQNPNSQYSAVIPKFIMKMLDGQSPSINGDGATSRDFTFVENVINATLLALEKKAAVGHAINIACNKNYTINDLVNFLNQILGKSIKPVYLPEIRGEVKHSLADISRARELLGYNPEIDFNKGLERTVEWFESNQRRFSKS
jgi:nucleoside-diphosphate-sugar epimerase